MGSAMQNTTPEGYIAVICIVVLTLILGYAMSGLD